MINHDLFLLQSEDVISNKNIVLNNKIETNHISSVLRKKVNDIISLSDGRKHYICKILQISKSSILFEIEQEFKLKHPQKKMILYPALLKGNQFDIQIEKSVELGVLGIQPIITDRVIANKDKVDKWTDVINKARKQCKQAMSVDIHSPKKILNLTKKENQAWIVPEIGVDTIPFEELVPSKYEEFCIYIGPEGGFTERELSHLRNQNATFHSLGNLRLRAETAAWKSIVIIQEIIKK